MKNLKIYLVLIVSMLGLIAYSQDFKVDTSASVLKWTGKKVTGKHYGHILLKDGSFTLKKKQFVGGVFHIDMRTITCDDLQGEMNAKLVGHLKSDDFFGVKDHPVSTLEIIESGKFDNGTGKATVKAKLTIKGITHPISFAATKDDNTFSAVIFIDRTLYNVRYGSGKFFDNLGDRTIDDKFALEVKIVAVK